MGITLFSKSAKILAFKLKDSKGKPRYRSQNNINQLKEVSFTFNIVQR